MTYIQWEREFQKCIKSLPEQEKQEIIGYYRELYADKREEGLSDDEIIKNFGTPMLCAATIMMDNASDEKESSETEKKLPPTQKEKKASPENADTPRSRSRGRITVASVVGWFFLITLFLIPLAAVLVSVFSALAACTLVGGATAITGVILAIASPFSLFVGYTVLSALATLGAALVAIGIGIVIFEVFFIITKYFAFVCFKLCRCFFKRRVN